AEGAKPTRLKGVLVLDDGKQVEGWAVNVPVFSSPSDDETISMLDPHLKMPIYTAAKTLPNNEITGFTMALFFALLGGMILNLMPCVLPVISIKILSFIQLAGQRRALIFNHGLLFSLGVLFSFWALAGSMLLLQKYGQTVGWGFQLQEPLFVAFL